MSKLHGMIDMSEEPSLASTKYKFNEDKALNAVESHILATYDSHYSSNKIQTTEFVFDAGHGEGFCMGNIIKYAQRYGKKNGKNKEDLLKLIHYAIILMGSELDGD